jgi:Flp pilus assembly protein TadG
MLRRFLAGASGNMSIVMVAAIGGLAIVATNVVDYMSLSNQRSSLQGLADRAALAAAQELVVFSGTDARVDAVATSFVKANYKGEVQILAAILEAGKSVKVTLSAAPQAFFPTAFSKIESVSAEATAEVSGGGYVCMVGLDASAVATLNMMNSARLSAPGCAVYSNSTSPKSLWLHDTARVSADLICVAGGVQGPDYGFTQSQPMSDCPAIEDPLRDRAKPAVGNLNHCDRTNLMVSPSQTVTLNPGIYCGGIKILGGQATLRPGVYTMKNGPIVVMGGGTLEGENAGFFLTGRFSTILFGRDSHISLSAPKTGDMSGLLFFEDRDTDFATYHQITSNDARNLVGTMYFPKSKLLIDATKPVADQSDYTVIIAREFELRDGPELVLNTNYESSTVPVPEGVGNNINTTVRLAK